MPTKYLRKQKVSRFADKSTKFKNCRQPLRPGGCGIPRTLRSDAPVLKRNSQHYRVSQIIRQGLYQFLLQNMALGLIFGGCIILIYQKMKLQSKNYEILNKQKLRKKIYIYLPLTCFLFRNSVFLLARKRFLKRMAYTALKQFE